MAIRYVQFNSSRDSLVRTWPGPCLVRGCRAIRVPFECDLDFSNKKFGDSLVEIVPPEPSVSVGRKHLENTVVQFEDGEVKRPAAQIVDSDFCLLLQLIQSICQSGRGRLVQDAFHG